MADNSNDRSLGLAGARGALSLEASLAADPQAIIDLEAMRQLRLSLDTLANLSSDLGKPDDQIPPTRSNAIMLLRCLKDTLAAPLGRPVPDSADSSIQMEHPAVALLDDLLGALNDLENAKTHAMLEKPEYSKGASLTSADARRRDALLELVDIVQITQGLRSRAAAERWVEQRVVKTMGRANAITAKQLKEMRKTRRKQRRKVSSIRKG